MKEKVRKLLDEKNIHKSYIKWIAEYTVPYIPQLVLLLIFNLFTTVLMIGMALVGKEMVDRASSGNTVAGYIWMYLIIVLVSVSVSFISELVSSIVNEKFSFGIRKQVYRRILDTNWLDITKYHTGDLMTRLTSDVSAVASGVSTTVPTIIQLLVQLIITFVTLAFFEWRLAVFSLTVAPIAAISSLWLGRKIRFFQIKVQESESKYRSFLQESLVNILIVKSFQTEDYSADKMTDLRDERLFWVLKRIKVGLVASTTMGLAFQLGYIAAFTWGSVCISKGLITFGTMTVFLTLVNQIQGPIVSLAQTIPKVVSMLASAGRIIELQDLPMEEKVEDNIKAEGIGLKINDLSFGYSENEAVFENAAVEFFPGEFTAIVGKSGIGKTTLIRLIMAFTNQAHGNINFYNSYGEEEKANAGVREFISYVPQGNTLFSGTIRDNICIGGVQASEEQIVEALKGAAAYDFVMKLPNGLDTRIGEKGYGISEGQAQRIAIARALLKKSPFMILDEATSALDPETEIKVLEGISKWEPRPTCLLISHRLSVLEYCDKQIMIENRRIKLCDIGAKI